MNNNFKIIAIIVAMFIGFLLGYSIPPFIHSGVFTGREVKGVEIKVDKATEDFYKNLYKEDDK
ncbi:hypothetical protein LCGC14_1929110 [marine sediment metagenome]|uniref:Uncharacterized protein n=1 Tax=marine sediment metagenome TaxID=412755 RepID=A0A0F9FNJ0_9ZZZZ